LYPLSAWRLAKGLGGELLDLGTQDRFTRLSTDTRHLKKGDVFLALKGETFDGERFFDRAIKAGAAALVGRKPPKHKGITRIKVSDSLMALQRLATDQRKLFSGPLLAITGSNGKTGVKECLAHLLGGEEVLSTPGNWNNHIGLPLTLLSLQPKHQVAVLELGMNHYGEIRRLGEICKPNVGIVLNVGDAHIGFFKSRLGIAKAKEELIESLDPSATAVLNGDDPLVRDMGRRFAGRQIRFGMGPSNDLRLDQVQDRGVRGLEARLSWQGKTQRLNLEMGGRARSYQALASLGGALAIGRELDPLLKRLKSFKAISRGRQEMRQHGGAHFILDTYNASPQSMDVALNLLELSAPAGKRLAILGDMLELGNKSKVFQRELGKRAQEAGLRALGALGPNAKDTISRFKGESKAFKREEADAAAQWLNERLRPGDWVLLKGSREMALERVFAELKQRG
jgi:UDP-N-acetylmuramoyl-tripeptide--D-alanyl-D-alanine ligase